MRLGAACAALLLTGCAIAQPMQHVVYDTLWSDAQRKIIEDCQDKVELIIRDGGVTPDMVDRENIQWIAKRMYQACLLEEGAMF
jgi:hypothetical protein